MSLLPAAIRISVVIPLYNKAETVIAALQSVEAQVCPADEVIIVDDGSTDNGVQRVRQWGKTVRLIQQANAGVSAARNRGIKESTSDWVAFLDADDTWKPDFLYRIRTMIGDYPQAMLLATAYETLTESGARTCKGWPGLPSLPFRGIVPDFFRFMTNGTVGILPSAAVAHKAALQGVGGFGVGQKLGEDQDLWARMALRYAIAFDTTAAATYTAFGMNRATAQYRVLEELPFSRNLQKALDRGEVPPRLRASARRYITFHLMNVARDAACTGNGAALAKALLDRRLFLHPLRVMELLLSWLKYRS